MTVRLSGTGQTVEHQPGIMRAMRYQWHAWVPPVSGKLVVVREVISTDADTLFELLSDPAVAEHLASPPPSIHAFRGFISWAQDERALQKGVCFGIVPHGLNTAVGIIQVRALEPTFFTAEWGFALGFAFWSTGVFIEAANLVADFAFTSLNVDRLEARVVAPNGRGHAVLQKLGARPEGRLARAFRKQGRIEPQLLWSLRQDDWRQHRLLDDRPSAADATAQIRRAIELTARASEEASPTADDRMTVYPFFLTESKTS